MRFLFDNVGGLDKYSVCHSKVSFFDFFWLFYALKSPVDRFDDSIHNGKDHQILCVGGPSRCATNLRWWTAAVLKIDKSPYFGNVLTDHNKMWHGDAY